MSAWRKDIADLERLGRSLGVPGAALQVRRTPGGFALQSGGKVFGRFVSRAAAKAARSRRLALEEQAAEEPPPAGRFKTKHEAVRTFMDWPPNREIIDDFGGPDAHGSAGEFGVLNEWLSRRGKQRVTTIREAIAAAISGKPPFYLSRIRLDLLNETAPVLHGRSGRSYELPPGVSEAVAEAEFATGAAAGALRTSARGLGRPEVRKPPVVGKVFGGQLRATGPSGSGFPLSGYECEDDAGRIVPCSSPEAVGPAVRVKYRPAIYTNGKTRPSVFLRPGDRLVAEEARSRADREDLRVAARAAERERLSFPFGPSRKA